MSKVTYKITLTPVEGYFFGGETTFGEGQAKNYFAKSNLLPQETALLGMLRYQILKLKGLLSATADQKKAVESAVGEKSFNYCDYEKDFSFGAIKRISPVFIGQAGDLFCKIPFNKDLAVSFRSDCKVFLGESGEGAELPSIKGFVSKDYNSDRWYSLDTDQGKIYTDHDIFFFKDKIGITKYLPEYMNNNEECFFKTRTCYLRDGFHFVFYAELDEDMVKLPDNDWVQLGAERSVFKMSVQKTASNGIACLTEKWQANWGKQLGEVESGIVQVFFISDAFIPEEVLRLCKFAWIDTKPFRNLTRNWKSGKNYAALNTANEKSDKYNIVRRGSLLFVGKEQWEKVESLITNDYLIKGGYNIYLKK